MERLLVTQALNELKLIDKRIKKEIDDLKVVAYAKTCEKNVNPNLSKEEFKSNALSGYHSINDLISRRQKIKNAIIESNAKTMVNICGEEMSVASVIDMKSSIIYKQLLLKQISTQYNINNKGVELANEQMRTRIDLLITTAFGKENRQNIKESDYESIAKPYRLANETSLVDPLGCKDIIKKMSDDIDEFNSTVDSVLQISNCITYIEF